MYLFPWLLCLSYGTWDPQLWHVGSSSPTKDGTQVPTLGAQSPSQLVTREALHSYVDVFEVSHKKNLKADKCIYTIHTHNGNSSVNWIIESVRILQLFKERLSCPRVEASLCALQNELNQLWCKGQHLSIHAVPQSYQTKPTAMKETASLPYAVTSFPRKTQAATFSLESTAVENY